MWNGLTDKERDQLERWARSRSLPSATVFRTRLILFLADGASYRAIEKKLDTRRPPSPAGGNASSRIASGAEGAAQGQPSPVVPCKRLPTAARIGPVASWRVEKGS